MDGRMGFARAARPGGNQVLEFLALGGAQLVGGDTRILLAHFLSGAGLLLGGDLTRLAGAQQGRHLIGIQEAGNAEVFLLFLGADLGTRAPRGTVEEDAVELGVRAQDLELREQVKRGHKLTKRARLAASQAAEAAALEAPPLREMKGLLA